MEVQPADAAAGGEEGVVEGPERGAEGVGEAWRALVEEGVGLAEDVGDAVGLWEGGEVLQAVGLGCDGGGGERVVEERVG